MKRKILIIAALVMTMVASSFSFVFAIDSSDTASGFNDVQSGGDPAGNFKSEGVITADLRNSMTQNTLMCVTVK